MRGRPQSDDTVITGKVKAAIAADSGMNESDVSVSTEGGVVTLAGTAKSPGQASRAAMLAERQQGVSRVENRIAIR